MPLVVLSHKKDRVLPDMLEKLAQALPAMVAEALTCEHPPGLLVAGDIEVWVRESSDYDVNVKDLEIVVWANHYDERQQNLHHRNVAVLNKVREFLADYDCNLNGYVWILLQPASFGEF